jgi:uncharacterized protein YggE
MRRLNYFPFLICLAGSVASAQIETRAPAIPEIATSGRGEIHVTPDQAVLSISVETRSSSAAAAAADNATRITRAIAAIRSAGIDSAQLTTAGYSVEPDYEKNRQIGFIVRNTLRVEVRRIPDIGRIIDAALAAGATRVNQVQFQRVNVQDARRSALALAVAEARRDAEVLAQAAGGRLGRLLYLTSGGSPSPVGRDVSRLETVMTSGGFISPTPIMPGDLSVVAVASARWEFVARPSQ